MKTSMLMLVVLVVAIFSINCESRTIEEMPSEEIVEGVIFLNASSQEPVNSVIIVEEEKPRYGFTDDDIYILAQLLCGDESYDGDGEYDFVYGALNDEMNYFEMSKVLCVVMNQVRSDIFKESTVQDIVLRPGNYSVFPKNLKTVPADIALEKVREWCEAYDRWDAGTQSIPESHIYFEAGPNLTNTTRENWR